MRFGGDGEDGGSGGLGEAWTLRRSYTQRGEGDQVFWCICALRVELDRVTGVRGGRQWAGLVRPLTPEAHADERFGSLQVMVLDV